MSIAQISKKAKALRKSQPHLSWHDAQRKAAAMLKGGRKTTHKRRGHTTAVAATKKSTPKRSRGVGSTSVGSAAVSGTRHKRKKKTSWLGATSASTTSNITVMKVVEFGGGLAGGALFVHKVLRPLENMVSSHIKSPYVAKAMPYVEAVLGTWGFLKFNNLIVRGASAATAGAGVHSIVKSFGHHTPAPEEKTKGMDEHLTTNVPISGCVRDMISGLLNNGQRNIRTSIVAGSDNSLINSNMPGGYVRTPIVGQSYVLDSTPVVGDADDDFLFMPKGRNY